MAEDTNAPFTLEQRDWSSYNTLADAVAGIRFKEAGLEVYIISEDKFYYWKNDIDGFVIEATGSSVRRIQTFAELTALPEVDLFDGELVLVENSGKIYRYDTQATTGAYLPDDDTDLIGWWIQTTAIFAADVFYNNGVSGLTATNVQGAIDEVAIAADKNYVYIQAIAASIWNITHNLGKFPSTVVVDSTNREVEGDIQHIDVNSLVITFSSAFTGKAFFN